MKPRIAILIATVFLLGLLSGEFINHKDSKGEYWHAQADSALIFADSAISIAWQWKEMYDDLLIEHRNLMDKIESNGCFDYDNLRLTFRLGYVKGGEDAASGQYNEKKAIRWYQGTLDRFIEGQAEKEISNAP